MKSLLKSKNRADEIFKLYEENFQRMEDEDAAAKAAGTLVGRYIREPYADGAAFYKITQEAKKTVRIQVVTGIGDDWIIPYFGKDTTIEKAYAVRNIKGRDTLAEIFTKHSSKQKMKEAAPCA